MPNSMWDEVNKKCIEAAERSTVELKKMMKDGMDKEEIKRHFAENMLYGMRYLPDEYVSYEFALEMMDFYFDHHFRKHFMDDLPSIHDALEMYHDDDDDFIIATRPGCPKGLGDRILTNMFAQL